MKTYILTLFFCISKILIGIGQGYEPLYQVEPSLQDVDFVDIETGWAVGYNGTILKTIDGGITWNKQVSGTNRYLLGLDFVNSTLGWAVGQFGTILKTTDGGNTWVTQTSGVAAELIAVQFINSTTGWATGQSGVILKTTNGGNTWTALNFGTANYFSDIFFLNTTIGWAVSFDNSGTSLILKTTNGGISWSSQSIATTASFWEIQFVNTTTGWIAGSGGTLLKTTDGGSTWIAQTLPASVSSFYKNLQFTDANNGWITAGQEILKTTNGGTTWTVYNSNSNKSINGLYVFDTNNAWVVCPESKIVGTSNGGSLWNTLYEGPSSINDIRIVSNPPYNQSGGVGNGGLIVRTFDSGLTWKKQNSNTTNSLYSIEWGGGRVAWVVGANGTILHTTDEGSNWSPQLSGVTDNLFDISYIREGSILGVSSRLFTCGANGTILKSIDEGTTWTSQISGVTNQLNDLSINGLNTVYVVGRQGVILKTTDGGDTWNAQISTTVNDLEAVYFTGSVGYAVGQSIILKTINGGTTWTNITPSNQTPTRYYDVSVIGGTLTIVGAGKTILTSNNGGNSFTSFTADVIATFPDFRSISSISGLLALLAGSSGIYKQTCISPNQTMLYPKDAASDISTIGVNIFSNTAVTLEANVELNTSTKAAVFSRGNPTNTAGFKWGIDNVANGTNTYKLWISGNNGSGWVDYYPISLGTTKYVWVHIALVLRPSTGTIDVYKDGVFQITIAAAFLLNGANFKTAIGGNYNTAVAHQSLYIDEMRIWNIARSATDINTNKDKHLIGNESGLIAYYSFNAPTTGNAGSEIKNDVINSTTGNAPNGIISLSNEKYEFKTINNILVNECQPIQFMSSPAETYLWKGPNGFTSKERNPTIPKANLASAGEYLLFVGRSDGCYAPIQKVQVTINHNYANVIKKSGTETGTNTYTAFKKLIAPPTFSQLNTISSSAKTTYMAGTSIDILPGFKTQTGAVFKAEIAGCN